MAILRTAFTMLVVAVLTATFALVIIVSAVLGVPNRAGSLYDVLPRLWSRAILWAAGVSVQIHGLERFRTGGPFIFICNHVSLFDIPALVGWLPRNNFVAKAELFRIPVFGPGIRVLGTVPIERDNQKAAFGSYDVASRRIHNGSSVVVFPEGTRGCEYPIRAFKKGPFVLAIKAGAPIVPVVVHGTIEILPKGSLLVHPGNIDVYMLDSVPTAGLQYSDRDTLAQTVRERMQKCMQKCMQERTHERTQEPMQEITSSLHPQT
ncbi:MAG: lysophospholipid acyltransferase family protein [Gemmatimonadaceae bacterium]